MARLEELKNGAAVKGLSADRVAKIVQIEWFGDQAAKVTYEDNAGRVGNRLVYRTDEPTLEVVQAGRAWSFDGDGALLRLVSEAYRIRLAYLFDPHIAVHISHIEPLPHQITAVYAEMLPRQPLRFLLADDPGAGKTIMAGLLIKELQIRGDLERCLIVAPGGLVEQWQDELSQKFGLSFEVLTRDQIEAARTGNPFAERSYLIARLDMLSRNDDLKDLLKTAREWDLVVCDEAHRMSASFFGGEVRYTKRYQLGQILGTRCRHLLMMSATPHNGKDEDFQLFMALLDGDRFEGRFRDGVHKANVSDMMRRLTKEELLKFDGRPLFPERRAYTAKFDLSDAEAALYASVTTYVREEMNRAERLAEGGEERRVNVGFALQILQRRLASSPAAIHESLRRRRERLDKRLAETRLISRGETIASLPGEPAQELEAAYNLEDLDEVTESEIEAAEEAVLDRATAARTIPELEREIDILRKLEAQARDLRRSGVDAKWNQLNEILDHPLMVDEADNRRKLIIFTEARDTLDYLTDKIRTRLGRYEAVVVIHGGVGREGRRKAVAAFTYDKDVVVMVANDAAGEGINLQRAHLMVNYDLPWNPNRLEQRFGRIHRIGQTEVCHLWNLVATDTREGEVYARLLEKLETARIALGGRVYDVLGRLFQGAELRELLINAIRYGERHEVKQRLFKAVDQAVEQTHLLELLEDRALVRDSMTASRVAEIREAMERAEALRLQPHYIQSFFLAGFKQLGGQMHRRENGRWEITRVPGSIRERDRQIGRSDPVLERYERACFEKKFISGPPVATFLCPGHPLLDATVDLILERYFDLLKKGAVLVNEADDGEEIHALFYLNHAIQDGRTTRSGQQQIVSQRLQFIEINKQGQTRAGGPAPYLDYRPLRDEEKSLVKKNLVAGWLTGDLESQVMAYAISNLVPAHVEEVKKRRFVEIDKIEQEVTARLKKEIVHWDHRTQQLKEQERAGKAGGRLNASQAAARANELADRLERRLGQLQRERKISALPPSLQGGALVVPAGLLKQRQGEQQAKADDYTNASPEARSEIERLAMDAVFVAERQLGFDPRDVSAARVGYDIESRDPKTGELRFIEVKGRTCGSDVVTATRNEILVALNKPDNFILAIVMIDNRTSKAPRYVRNPFHLEPDFGATSVNYKLADLLQKAKKPS